jgi:hypothetical protein
MRQAHHRFCCADECNSLSGTDGFRAPEMHFLGSSEEMESFSNKKLEPDIFSFGVTLYALATNGLTPWHPSIALCNFDNILQRNCGSVGEFIQQQQHAELLQIEEHHQSEQQQPHRMLDEQTGCIFIAGQGGGNELPSAGVITALAWMHGCPNTTVRCMSHVTRHTSHVTRHTSHVTHQICCCPSKLSRYGPHTRINRPPSSPSSSSSSSSPCDDAFTASEVEFCSDSEADNDALRFYGRSEGDV